MSKILEITCGKNSTNFTLEYVEQKQNKISIVKKEDRINEEWREIKEFENYEISNYGIVRSKLSGKELKQEDTSGYCRNSIANTMLGNVKKSVHILVAKAFLEIPETKGETMNVDHIDNNVYNNHYTNLRWTTVKENQNNRRREEKVTPIIFLFLNDSYHNTFYKFSDIVTEYKLSETSCRKIFDNLNKNEPVDINQKLKKSKWFTGSYTSDFIDEIWKQIKIKKLQESVNISSYGRIETKIRTTGTTNNRYCQFYGEQIHRLVLDAFEIPHINKNDECNHINSKQYDNRLTNLEWISPSLNSKLGNASKKKCISRRDITTNEVVVFNSLKEAAQSINMLGDSIRNYINKKSTISGYEWCDVEAKINEQNKVFDTLENYYILQTNETGQKYLYLDLDEITKYTNIKRYYINKIFNNYRKDYGKHKFKFLKKTENTIESITLEYKDLNIPSKQVTNIQNASIQNASETRLRPVVQYNLFTGEYINRFKSSIHATENVENTNAKVIQSVCSRTGKFQSGGFIWKFEDETDGTNPIDVTSYTKKDGLKQVIFTDENGNETSFNSTKEVAKKTGFTVKQIQKFCNNEQKVDNCSYRYDNSEYKKIAKYDPTNPIHPLKIYDSRFDAKADNKNIKKAMNIENACEKGGRIVGGFLWKFI